MKKIIPQLINVTLFPGSREDSAKTRMELQLVFDDADQATAWLESNKIPTEYLNRRPGSTPLPRDFKGRPAQMIDFTIDLRVVGRRR